MEEITVYGMGTKPTSVSDGTMVYNENDKVLKVQELTFSMNSDWQLTITV